MYNEKYLKLNLIIIILKKKEKEKKRQYHRERNLIYSTFQRQVEYMRNYYLTHQK